MNVLAARVSDIATGLWSLWPSPPPSVALRRPWRPNHHLSVTEFTARHNGAPYREAPPHWREPPHATSGRQRPPGRRARDQPVAPDHVHRVQEWLVRQALRVFQDGDVLVGAPAAAVQSRAHAVVAAVLIHPPPTPVVAAGRNGPVRLRPGAGWTVPRSGRDCRPGRGRTGRAEVASGRRLATPQAGPWDGWRVAPLGRPGRRGGRGWAARGRAAVRAAAPNRPGRRQRAADRRAGERALLPDRFWCGSGATPRQKADPCSAVSAAPRHNNLRPSAHPPSAGSTYGSGRGVISKAFPSSLP